MQKLDMKTEELLIDILAQMYVEDHRVEANEWMRRRGYIWRDNRWMKNESF